MDNDLIILDEFINNHPSEAAHILEQQEIGNTISFLKEIPILLQVRLVNEMERFIAVKCLEMLEQDRSAKIFERLPFSTSGIILRQMTKDLRESILSKIEIKISSPLQQVLEYGPETVGAMMNPLVPTLSIDFTVKESIQYIKKQSGMISEYIYIVNRDHTLAGLTTLQELLTMQLNESITVHLQTNIITLLADTDYHSIIDHPAWLEYHTLPVVDAGESFLGAIDHKTLRQIREDRSKPYLSKQAIETSNALGDLFRLGFTGLLTSAFKPYNRDK